MGKGLDMHRLNEIILEKMEDVPPISKLNDFTSDVRSAQRILRFIENCREYHWAARYYFINADDGPTQIDMYFDVLHPGGPFVSVTACTFAMAVSLAFLAAEVYLEELQAEADAQKQEDQDDWHDERMSGIQG